MQATETPFHHSIIHYCSEETWTVSKQGNCPLMKHSYLLLPLLALNTKIVETVSSQDTCKTLDSATVPTDGSPHHHLFTYAIHPEETGILWRELTFPWMFLLQSQNDLRKLIHKGLSLGSELVTTCVSNLKIPSILSYF